MDSLSFLIYNLIVYVQNSEYEKGKVLDTLLAYILLENQTSSLYWFLYPIFRYIYWEICFSQYAIYLLHAYWSHKALISYHWLICTKERDLIMIISNSCLAHSKRGLTRFLICILKVQVYGHLRVITTWSFSCQSINYSLSIYNHIYIILNCF